MRLAVLCLFAIGPPLCLSQNLSTEQELGKSVFQACRHCHNVLTDARKAGPSLRTLFGKVRLANGKRTLEDNVAEFIREGKDGMPSYRYMFRPEDFNALMAYLKTLQSRPEIRPVLKPIRGSDEEVLAAGKSLYFEHCAGCHEHSTVAAPPLRGIYSRRQLSTGEPAVEFTIVPKVRDGHGRMEPKRDTLNDEDLFRLLAFLKAQ